MFPRLVIAQKQPLFTRINLRLGFFSFPPRLIKGFLNERYAVFQSATLYLEVFVVCSVITDWIQQKTQSS